MNKLFLIAAIVTSTESLGIRLVVADPCSDGNWLEAQAEARVGDSAGEATVATLTAHEVPFVGEAGGISSIRGTVTGDAALEILSGVEMRAYGWCYSVNGVEPDVFPDQIALQADTDVVRWVFGYAHYLNGDWISYCTPTSETKPAYICGVN